jgi:hypothetical protein
MSSNPLGSTVDDNIGPEVDRAYNVSTSPKCVVYNKRNAIVMRYLGKLWDRSDVILGVTDAFDIKSFGILVDCGSEGFRLVVQDKLDGYTELLQKNFELVIGTTVEVRAL